LKFGRERFAKLKWKLLTSKQIKFIKEKTPYLFSTYHEKVVIVDNSCAFIGGMDLAGKRWDTSHHLYNNFLRTDHHGHEYFPVHDLQIVISGSVVKDLKRILHNREDAQFDLKMKVSHKLWPDDFPSELDDVDVAIMRTDPKVGACEIERFYEDAIRVAKDYIYIENQYISCNSLTELLCQRLREENGPEVIFTIPYSYRGGFECAIYTKSRNRSIRMLKASDLHSRLSICYPKLAGNNKSKYMIVHSKLLIVDGRLMSIGSANLNNRSLRVDNEINLGFEALSKEHKTAKFVSGCLSRLLSEHLDINELDFLNKLHTLGSVLNTIRHFQDSQEKTLEAMPYVELTVPQKVMTVLEEFVDIRFTIPRYYLYIIISIILTSAFFIMR